MRVPMVVCVPVRRLVRLILALGFGDGGCRVGWWLCETNSIIEDFTSFLL